MIHSEKYNAIQTVTVMIHGKKKDNVAKLVCEQRDKMV